MWVVAHQYETPVASMCCNVVRSSDTLLQSRVPNLPNSTNGIPEPECYASHRSWKPDWVHTRLTLDYKSLNDQSTPLSNRASRHPNGPHCQTKTLQFLQIHSYSKSIVSVSPDICIIVYERQNERWHLRGERKWVRSASHQDPDVVEVHLELDQNSRWRWTLDRFLEASIGLPWNRKLKLKRPINYIHNTLKMIRYIPLSIINEKDYFAREKL